MISAKDFVQLMNDWKSIQEAEEGVHRAFKILSPDFGGFYLDRHDTLFMKILELAMDDYADWISYYVYELDWGKNWKKGMITEDGKDIKLSTPMDLWRVLRDNIKSRREENENAEARKKLPRRKK